MPIEGNQLKTRARESFHSGSPADRIRLPASPAASRTASSEHALNTEIPYRPDLIQRFEGHHASLRKVFESIQTHAANGRFDDAMNSLRTFQRVLTTHLFEENLKLYTYLSRCLADDSDDRLLMHTMQSEMEQIGATAMRFVDEYVSVGVTRFNQAKFLAGLDEIGAQLAERMQREEETLYTLYMPQEVLRGGRDSTGTGDNAAAHGSNGRIHVPALAPYLPLLDVYGKPVTIGGASGRRTLLCFFRDPACPFCNFRLYQLTHRYRQLANQGLEIIAVFAASPAEVKRFAARYRRPFPVIVDPASAAYDAYGIERSFWRKLKAIVTRVPTLLRGLRIVGLAGLRTNNLLPADFLIDEKGHVVEAWYGRDAGDRIPFERIEAFAAQDAPKHNHRAS